jgi:hypothetical protein
MPAPPIPLRWGDAATRWWIGGWLLIGGGVAIAGSNTEALWVLAIGTLAHLAGWCVLPTAGWRRTVAAGPATLTMWLLLTGPRFVFVLVVPYLLWLLVRSRSALAAVTALLVAAVALLVGDAFGQDYSRMLAALVIVGVAMVAADWFAALIDRRRSRRR